MSDVQLGTFEFADYFNIYVRDIMDQLSVSDPDKKFSLVFNRDRVAIKHGDKRYILHRLTTLAQAYNELFPEKQIDADNIETLKEEARKMTTTHYATKNSEWDDSFAAEARKAAKSVEDDIISSETTDSDLRNFDILPTELQFEILNLVKKEDLTPTFIRRFQIYVSTRVSNTVNRIKGEGYTNVLLTRDDHRLKMLGTNQEGNSKDISFPIESLVDSWIHMYGEHIIPRNRLRTEANLVINDLCYKSNPSRAVNVGGSSPRSLTPGIAAGVAVTIGAALVGAFKFTR